MMAFRFQSFRFLADYPSVYLHCRAYSCAITDNGDYCNQNCRASSLQQSAGRRRRDVSGTAAEYQVNSGTIVVVEYSEVVGLPSASNGKLVLCSLWLNCQEIAGVSVVATERIYLFIYL